MPSGVEVDLAYYIQNCPVHYLQSSSLRTLSSTSILNLILNTMTDLYDLIDQGADLDPHQYDILKDAVEHGQEGVVDLPIPLRNADSALESLETAIFAFCKTA